MDMIVKLKGSLQIHDHGHDFLWDNYRVIHSKQIACALSKMRLQIDAGTARSFSAELQQNKINMLMEL